MELIPPPTRERLLSLMRLLEHIALDTLSSSQIENLTGWASHTIRKDISYLSEIEGNTIGSPAGYEKKLLLPLIKKALGLDRKRKFCVVGLGRLGSAYLNLQTQAVEKATGLVELGEFELAAGFDINVNRTEILPSPVPLYPAYKIGEIIGRFNIEIALLCVPATSAQEAAEKLVAAGIKGIVNFAPAALNLLPQIAVRNVFLTDELRALAVKIGE